MRDTLRFCGMWIGLMSTLWCASWVVGHGFTSIYHGKIIDDDERWSKLIHDQDALIRYLTQREGKLAEALEGHIRELAACKFEAGSPKEDEFIRNALKELNKEQDQ